MLVDTPMFASPRVIAIDDEKDHLDGLVSSLSLGGVACLPLQYTGFVKEQAQFQPCPDVRIIFADLQLDVSQFDDMARFGTLRSVLQEIIRPQGPYFIVLWTQYPKKAVKLEEYLLERLEGVTKPFKVLPLDKAEHGGGYVKNKDKLIGAIFDLIKELPQIGALFDWETGVLRAAGDTVTSVLKLASTKQPDQRASEVGRILSQLAIGAVGKKHVEVDRFQAVNEALLPILADRNANRRSTVSDARVWNTAIPSPLSPEPFTLEEAASLNRMANVDVPDKPRTIDSKASERGAVIPLPTKLRRSFKERFGIEESDAAKKSFHCNCFAADNDCFRWVLVQTQAACDHVLSRPGPVPCYLGLEMPFPTRAGVPPMALWKSPALELDSKIRQLRVSALFPLSIGPAKFSEAIDNATPIYRLREQMLNELIYHMHSHGARPGMMSFRDE